LARSGGAVSGVAAGRGGKTVPWPVVIRRRDGDEVIATALTAFVLASVLASGVDKDMTGKWVTASGVHLAITCGNIPLIPMKPATTTTAASKILGPIEAPRFFHCLCAGPRATSAE
jgi:hypothetical protein